VEVVALVALAVVEMAGLTLHQRFCQHQELQILGGEVVVLPLLLKPLAQVVLA
jgi:hypothetical protein